MNTALKRLGVTFSLAMLAAAPLGAAPLQASAHHAAWQVYDRETVVDTATGASYIIFGNVRHLVNGPKVLSLLGINYNSLPRWSDGEVNALPQGDPLNLRLINGQISQLSPIAAGSATLALSASTVGRGQDFSVAGTGYAANESVEVVFDYGQITHWVHADSNGQFATSFSVPGNSSTGILRVFAYGANSKVLEVEPIQVTAQPVISDGALVRDTSNGTIYLVWNGVRHRIADANVFAALGFNSNSTQVQNESNQDVASLREGDAITFRMSGSQVFPLSPLQSGSGVVWLSLPSAAPGNSIQLSGSNFGHYEHVQISFAGSTTTVQTDQNGSFSATISIPGSATIGSILDVYMLGQSSNLFVVEPISVISPSAPVQVTAQGSTFQQGRNGQVSASGFAPNEQVLIFLAQNASVVAVNADGNGNVNATVPVPSSLSTGSHSLVLFGTSSKRAAYIQVTILPAPAPAALHIDHQSVTPGSQVMLSGSGYQPNESITIRVNGQQVQTVNADNNGQFSNTVLNVPLSTSPGNYSVTATGNSSGNSASAQLTVVAFNASLQLAGGNQVAGGTIWLNGHGFFNGEVVTFTLDGQNIGTNPSTVNASSNGDFSVSIALPGTLSPGSHTLVATGASSHASASVTLQVQGQNPAPAPSTSHVWYFPRGDTHSNYTTMYYLTNNHGYSVQVSFTFSLGNSSPMSYSLWLQAYGHSTLDLRNVVGSYHDVFAVVSAQENIQVREVVTYNNHNVYSTTGVAHPRNTWIFNGGNNGRNNANETLIVANPGNQTCNVQILFITQGRRYIYHSLSLVSGGFLTLDVASYFPNVPRGQHIIYLRTTNGESFIAQHVAK
jgi:hypothetical protein